MLNLLRQLPISRKLWLLTLLTAAGLITTTLFALAEYHRDLIQEKKAQTQALVETTYSVVADLHAKAEAGNFDRQEAQTRAKEVIKSLRYDDSNYFWINDFNARIVMHPIKPQLDGKDMSGFTDPDGKRIFSEFARVAKRDGGGGPLLLAQTRQRQTRAENLLCQGIQALGLGHRHRHLFG